MSTGKPQFDEYDELRNVCRCFKLPSAGITYLIDVHGHLASGIGMSSTLGYSQLTDLHRSGGVFRPRSQLRGEIIVPGSRTRFVRRGDQHQPLIMPMAFC